MKSTIPSKKDWTNGSQAPLHLKIITLEKTHRLGLHITVGGAYARIPHRIEAVGHDLGTLQRPRTPDAIAFPGVLGQ